MPTPAHRQSSLGLRRSRRFRRRQEGSRLRGPVLFAAFTASFLGLVAAVAATPALATGPALPGGIIGYAATSSNGSVYTNVSYNASTDGFPLSFGEVLPAGFQPSSPSPLLVYLHGEGSDSNWTRGGSGNDLGNYTNKSLPTSALLTHLVENASANHFIIIAPSPRTADGFYTNTPCGGPQEQDTLDAIAVEEARHQISSVYLLGFSMGSIGALSLAAHHVGSFAGVAVFGTLTDVFEDFAAHPGIHSGLLPMVCGQEPSPGNSTTVSIFTYLSAFRFHPQNFSNTPIWIAAGGNDRGAPDNPNFAPYLQVNDTIMVSTCAIQTGYGEPTNCTAPLAHLHTLNPTLYHFRFVYEPLATHSAYQLSPSDMFRYLLGKEGGGCFTSSFPPNRMTACP